MRPALLWRLASSRRGERGPSSHTRAPQSRRHPQLPIARSILSPPWTCAQAKEWCQRNAKAKNAKAAAVERLLRPIEVISEDLAISKTQQRHVIEGTFRHPRFDAGQRLSVFLRGTGSNGWFDSSVVHGGAKLCVLDRQGQISKWCARAVDLTGFPLSAKFGQVSCCLCTSRKHASAPPA